MADRISARRGLANSFFLTINTAVLGVLGTQSSRWYFAVAGITLSVAWWASLVSYRNLNAVKKGAVVGDVPVKEKGQGELDRFVSEWWGNIREQGFFKAAQGQLLSRQHER